MENRQLQLPILTPNVWDGKVTAESGRSDYDGNDQVAHPKPKQ